MKCFKLLITSSVSILFLIQVAFGCDIILKKEATATSNQITIKEIASVYPKKVAKVVISPAPFANNSITLTKSYVQFLLKQKGINLKVCGSTTKVRAKAFLLTRTLIKRIIKSNLKIITPLPIYLPFDKYKFKVSNVSYSNKFKFFTITALRKGKPFKNITIMTQRHPVCKLIPVAKKDIEIGENIFPSDITYKELKQVPPNTFLLKSSIVNRVAINFIPKGTPFSTANTKKFKPVKIGDIVNVEVIAGRIKIGTVAKALRGGYKGDTIPIMYISSKKVVPALIIGKKRVLVQ